MTYFFETYGCEMNIAESAAMEQLLIARGWTLAPNAQVADMMIINTCTIRKSADERIEGRLGWINGLKAVRAKKLGAKTKLLDQAVEYVKDGPRPLTVVVTGCLAERMFADFKKKFPFVDYVVGTFGKHHFGEIITAVEEKAKPFPVENDSPYVFAPCSAEPGAFSTFVPIMHGCNNFCTYCIVPYVRGRECSRPVEEILKEIDVLTKLNVREICLIGQNVNSYAAGEVNFAGLLQIIADHLRNTHSTIEWVRFMSSHPKDFTDDVIDAIAECDKVCKLVHLPLQAGNTKVLKEMNRKYTQEEYLNLVEKMKAKIPNLTLSTDIIVGFPGETDEEFEDTLNVVKKVNYEQVYMFIYSRRIGTPGDKMENQIPEEQKHKRFDKLKELVESQIADNNKKYVGTIQKILIEGESKNNPDMLTGRTDSNKVVVIKADKKLIGTIKEVKIVSEHMWYLRGE